MVRRDHHGLFRYFAEKALCDDTPEFLKTLTIVATLDEFRLEDLMGAFGITESEALIRQCEKRSLYLQRTGLIACGVRCFQQELHREYVKRLLGHHFGSQGLDAVAENPGDVLNWENACQLIIKMGCILTAVSNGGASHF